MSEWLYHELDLPGLPRGMWDLRGRELAYFGGISPLGMRCLDVGPGTGAMSLWMSRLGAAEVTALELGDDDKWDTWHDGIAEQQRAAVAKNQAAFREAVALTNAANIVMCRGSIYNYRGEGVDIVLLGAILRHLERPFEALRVAVRAAGKAVIVTQQPPTIGPLRLIPSPWPRFMPCENDPSTWDSWWMLPSGIVCRWLQILGLTTVTTWHWQRHFGKKRLMYTIVARKESAW